MIQLGTKALSLPFIQGGMGIGISLGGLAGAVAAQGAMGVVSAANPGYREPDFWQSASTANQRALTAEIKKAKQLARGAGLVGVNIMVATTGYADTVQTAVDAGADAIISGAGLPLELPAIAEKHDVLLAPVISSARAAAVLCRSWKQRYCRLPDFLVLEGASAGGHLGFSMTELISGAAKSLFVLLSEVLQVVREFGNIPVFVAGGVAENEICSLIAQGAAGVQLATPFLTTNECDASAEYKKIFSRAISADVCLVHSPVGMPARALRSPLVARLAQGERFAPIRCAGCLVPCRPAQTPYCITRALIEAAKGNWDEGLFFCGANVGQYQSIVPVKQRIDEILQAWRNL